MKKTKIGELLTTDIKLINSYLLILIVLGLVPWNSLFKIEAFTKFHTWIGEIAIKDFAIFGKMQNST